MPRGRLPLSQTNPEYAAARKENPYSHHKTSLSLTAELEEALDLRAVELGMTRSELCREILSQWIGLGTAPPERGFAAGWYAGFRAFEKGLKIAYQEFFQKVQSGEIDQLRTE